MSAGIFNFTPEGGECVIFTPRFSCVVLIQINRERETGLKGSQNTLYKELNFFDVLEIKLKESLDCQKLHGRK